MSPTYRRYVIVLKVRVVGDGIFRRTHTHRETVS